MQELFLLNLQELEPNGVDNFHPGSKAQLVRKSQQQMQQNLKNKLELMFVKLVENNCDFILYETKKYMYLQGDY